MLGKERLISGRGCWLFRYSPRLADACALSGITSSTVVGGARTLGRVHAPRTNTSTCLIPGNIPPIPIPIPSGSGISSATGVPACSDRARTVSRITCIRGATQRYHDMTSDVTSSIALEMLRGACAGVRRAVRAPTRDHRVFALSVVGVGVLVFQLPSCPGAQTTSARIDASHPLRLRGASRLIWPVRCPRARHERGAARTAGQVGGRNVTLPCVCAHHPPSACDIGKYRMLEMVLSAVYALCGWLVSIHPVKRACPLTSVGLEDNVRWMIPAPRRYGTGTYIHFPHLLSKTLERQTQSRRPATRDRGVEAGR